MSKSVTYTNGVIAVKETSLLKDKIYKLCEGSAEEAFRALSEGGFGHGAEALSVYNYEALVAADERDLDAFIHEYATGKAEEEYLLSPRDFHNAKALVKAEYLGLDVKPMLAPEGIYSIEEISACIKGEETRLNGELKKALKEAKNLFVDSEGNALKADGAEVGRIFDIAEFEHLFKACSRNGFLKKLLIRRVDMTNILTALRAKTPEYAEVFYIGGGKLGKEKLNSIFSENADVAERAMDGTEYWEFYIKCLKQREAGLPLTEAEKLLADLECDSLEKRKYELKNSQPFLYYVFRRRAENANVRILFVCLLAGMKEGEIRRRLRAV